MPVQKIQTVYAVVRDMDGLQTFYETALGLTTRFRDGQSWCQFAAGNVNFALSSVAEAAPGAAGATVVFETTDLEEVRRDIERAGGRHLISRDMGSHGRVITFADPEGHVFQVFAKSSLPQAPSTSHPNQPTGTP